VQIYALLYKNLKSKPMKKNNILKIKTVLLAITIAFLSIKSTAQTFTYLAYDGFQWANNLPLNASSGGTGWASPWDVQGPSNNVPGYQFVTGNLSYSSLQTVGNKASGGYLYRVAGRPLNTASTGPFAAYMLNSTQIGTQYGTTLWASALLRKDINNPQDVFVAFHNSVVSWAPTNGTSRTEFGYFGAASDVATQKRWSLKVNGVVYPTAVPITINTAAFLVFKFEFISASSTKISLYVNPSSLGATLPSSPTYTINSSVGLQFSKVAAYIGGMPGDASLDELRIGSSYQSVAPDNLTTVNAPPLSLFTVSSNSGIAPFVVTFNGSASSSASGPLTYTWKFGDGQQITGSAIQTHTFNTLGLLTAELKVTDPLNQSNSSYAPISVLNQNNSYPCLSTITSLSMASCGLSNGAIQVNTASSNSIVLQNNLNVTMPLTSPNKYLNLAAGVYTLAVNGSVCKDTFQIYIKTDSLTCPGWQPPGLCAMDMGMNLGGIADFTPLRPFRNLMKLSRAFVEYTNACSCWGTGPQNSLVLDTAGYPIYLPQTNTVGIVRATLILSTSTGTACEGQLVSGSQYVLLYDGVGVMTLYGATTVTHTAGRLQFNVTSAGNNIYIKIDSSAASNHLRNMRLLKLSDEFTNLSVLPFNQNFLNVIAPFKVLRFMDWQGMNHSGYYTNQVWYWSDRAKPSYRSYAFGECVPHETIIKLANTANKDIWISVPYAADDNYVTQMALLYKNGLNPNLKVYLEYSNEVWNWQYPQTHYNDQTKPSNLGYGAAIAVKANRVFKIWHQVWGSQKSRVKRVLGLQRGYHSLNQDIMAQLKQSEWDCAAPTWYFGPNHTQLASVSGSVTPAMVNNSAYNWILADMPNIKQDFRNVFVLGKELVTYEGGQHYTNGTVPTYSNAMYDSQIDPSVVQPYQLMLDSFRVYGCKIAMAYSLAGKRQSIYGSWGHLEDTDQQPPYNLTAPKYQVLLNNIGTNCSPVTGIKDYAKKVTNGIMYPNPTNGKFTIALSNGATIKKVEIHNLLGQSVNFKSTYDGENMQIDLLDNPSGIYIVTCGENENLLTTKIVYQR
jgi:hypothetical protein